jgi:FkbM family methyltransferase
LYGEYSESEVSVFRAFMRPGDTVLDIGANIGDLTLPMARIVGPSGRVIAVESHSDTYHVLCANMALNGIEHVRALNGFVADRPDVGWPDGGASSASSASGSARRSSRWTNWGLRAARSSRWMWTASKSRCCAAPPA